MEIQHSPSEVRQLQEYLGCLLTGDEIHKGSLFDEKFRTFTLKDFQESFNWTNSYEVEVIDAILVPDMVRSIPCVTKSEAVDMVAFGNILHQLRLTGKSGKILILTGTTTEDGLSSK